MPSDDDLVAQFLASGGKVKKCPTGESALGLSASQWGKEVSKPGTVQGRARAQEDKNERRALSQHERAHDAFFVGDRDEAYRILDED